MDWVRGQADGVQPFAVLSMFHARVSSVSRFRSPAPNRAQKTIQSRRQKSDPVLNRIHGNQRACGKMGRAVLRAFPTTLPIASGSTFCVLILITLGPAVRRMASSIPKSRSCVKITKPTRWRTP